MNLRELASLPYEARRVMLDQLLERLPAWLELVDPAALQPRFRDRRQGESWRLFAGGAFEMGATPSRLQRLHELQSRHPLRLSPESFHQPARTLEVRPFLMMEQVIGDEADAEDPKILISDHATGAQLLLEARGVRLPTEAEWEFAWREVQAQPAYWVPQQCELCADGWSTDLSGLAGFDPLVPGGPSLLRTASFDLDAFECVLPARQTLKGMRLATIRGVLDVPSR